MKKCTLCEQIKDADKFYKDKTRPDGLEHRCKPCKIQCSKRYKNLSSKEHKVCSKCKVKKSINDFYKASYSSDGVASYCKICKRKVRKQWRKDTKEVRNAQRNSYLKNNPEINHKIRENRRTREYEAKGSHTLNEWILNQEEYNNKCGYCGESKKITKDHKTPLSRGGTNNIDNIIPACKECNSSKCDKTYEEFVILEANRLEGENRLNQKTSS